jgi:acyl-CoA synthetase (AMP-forming)/AMP-acid ligase II
MDGVPTIGARDVAAADARRFRALGLWGHLSLAELLDRQAARHPGKLALADAEVRWTYAELVDLSRRLARVLVDFDVGPGDVVATQLPSSGLLPLVHFACSRLGALFVPMSTTWRRAEVGSLLAAVRAKVLVAVCRDGQFDLAALHRELRSALPCLIRVVAARETGAGSLEALLERAEPLSAECAAALRPDPCDPGHVMVSSGTTGTPKASVWSTNNVVAMMHQTAHALRITEDDVAGGLAPAGLGSTGYVFPILYPLLLGATSVILERWSPRAALELLDREQCTYATAVPAQLGMLLESPGLESFDLSRLTRINNAGAPLSPAVATQVETRMACRLQTVYGATDGGVAVMTAIIDPPVKRRTTVGRVVAGEELRIRGPDGGLAASGEVGEVWWRGANKSFGYLNQPDQDAAAFSADGWFRSGDLGLLDADGYLRIVGRTKDMILRGGANIYPHEIETALSQHPHVREAAVVGVPDARLGERACAVIAPTSPAPDLGELTVFLTDMGLARFKHPEFLVLLDEFPTNAGGKHDKSLIREHALRCLGRLADRGDPFTLP